MSSLTYSPTRRALALPCPPLPPWRSPGSPLAVSVFDTSIILFISNRRVSSFIHWCMSLVHGAESPSLSEIMAGLLVVFLFFYEPILHLQKTQQHLVKVNVPPGDFYCVAEHVESLTTHKVCAAPNDNEKPDLRPPSCSTTQRVCDDRVDVQWMSLHVYILVYIHINCQMYVWNCTMDH